MGSRSAIPTDLLPRIEFDFLLVESGPQPRARCERIDFRLPGIERLERLRTRYRVTVGAFRAYRPRRDSTVHRRLARAAAEVAASLGFDASTYDARNGEYRLPLRLRLRWSWPELPMWLVVAEWSSSTCVLRVSLRSHRRLRYPWRYFDAAHAALADLERSLEGGTPRGTSGAARDGDAQGGIAGFAAGAGTYRA